MPTQTPSTPPTMEQLGELIEKVPKDIASRPILQGLHHALTQLSAQMAQQATQMAQQFAGSGEAPPEIIHWQHGICQDEGCGTCADASQAAVQLGLDAGMAQGRQSLLDDFDAAFADAVRPDLAEAVSTVYLEWVANGRPQPAPESQ